MKTDRLQRLGRTGAFAVVLAAMVFSTSTYALAPEHESHRLMLATEQAVKDANWNEASEYLNKLQKLDVKKPDAYQYYRGRVMFESGLLNEARSALEAYVKQSGAEGQYYNQSLELITRIEQTKRQQAEQPQASKSGKPVAMIEPAGKKPVQRLEELYLVDSPIKALTLHLNSLLELDGWRRDPKVIVAGSKPDIGYQVSTQAGVINLQESRRDLDGADQFRLTTQAIKVYGVNPDVNWKCVAGDQACWVYDPRDDSRLMRLAPDPDQAKEVAETLGRLIKAMQQPPSAAK